MTSARKVESAATSDADLLARIVAGDLQALGTLYDRHVHAVRRFLARLAVGHADLDDLVQLTFLEVVRAARRFDARYAAKPWLFGIAASMTRRHRRSFAKMSARVRSFVWARASSDPERPDQAFEGREAERRFRSALASLAEKKREVFVMITLEGASGEETAMALGIPIKTVWTRLHHARAELRKSLAEGQP